MKINHDAVLEHSRASGESLTALFERAGVSRTAYYSLARRSSILPRTVRAIAAALGVSESELLEETPVAPVDHPRLRKAREICSRHPDADFHNVWHTLTLLEQSPLERLRGSLRRGRA
jgi:transcriptional regulator with XRE-family HTH domain